MDGRFNGFPGLFARARHLGLKPEHAKGLKRDHYLVVLCKVPRQNQYLFLNFVHIFLLSTDR